MPAFIVAEAASERDDDRGEGCPGGPWRGSGLVGIRACRGEPEDEREGGSELRSGMLVDETQLE